MPKINRTTLIYFFLAIFTLAAFWNVTQSGFINYDDQFYITWNTHIQQA